MRPTLIIWPHDQEATLVSSNVHDTLAILVLDGWRVRVEHQDGIIYPLWHAEKYNPSREWRNHG